MPATGCCWEAPRARRKHQGCLQQQSAHMVPSGAEGGAPFAGLSVHTLVDTDFGSSGVRRTTTSALMVPSSHFFCMLLKFDPPPETKTARRFLRTGAVCCGVVATLLVTSRPTLALTEEDSVGRTSTWCTQLVLRPRAAVAREVSTRVMERRTAATRILLPDNSRRVLLVKILALTRS